MSAAEILPLIPLWYWVLLATGFGLLIGSFLNVVIYRVPQGMTLGGRSMCPHCQHQIRAWDNIPVLSWLILRGRCRDCAAPISPRYPLVEASTAAAWIGVTLWGAGTGNAALVPLLLIFASVSIALTLIDFDTMRLPDVLVIPMTAITAIYLTVLAWTTNQWDHLLSAAGGAAAMFAFFLLLHVGSKGRGLGFGDVKLSITLGALLGWFGYPTVIVGVFAAFLIGGLPAAFLMLIRKLKAGMHIPFGPMLLAGTWIGILWGTQLSDLYLQLAHLG